MLKRSLMGVVWVAGLCAFAGGQDGAWSPPPTPAAPPAPAISGQFEGLTRPSRRVQLALRVSGVIASRPVSEGQRVKAGDLIVELDSELEKATLEITRLSAESEHAVQAQVMEEKQAEVEMNRVTDLVARGAATKWELEGAKVKLEIAKVKTEFAKFQRALKERELARARIELGQRRLVAPCDGIIYRTMKEAGEAVQELTPVAEMVQLDPLWVEVNLPAAQFAKIKPGQQAAVEVGGNKARPAKVIVVDPLVDAASATFRVRLELSNSDSACTAGLTAKVSFAPAAEK